MPSLWPGCSVLFFVGARCSSPLWVGRLRPTPAAQASHGHITITGPVAQWIRHRPTEPGIAGLSPAGIILVFPQRRQPHQQHASSQPICSFLLKKSGVNGTGWAHDPSKEENTTTFDDEGEQTDESTILGQHSVSSRMFVRPFLEFRTLLPQGLLGTVLLQAGLESAVRQALRRPMPTMGAGFRGT